MNSGRVITIDSKHTHHKSAFQGSPLREKNDDSHSMSFTCAAGKPQNTRLNISALEDSRPRDKSPLMTERRSTLGSKIYEMLRELEPSLPAIPTSMTDDQTLEYIKIATSVMRRKQNAVDQQIKALTSELQGKELLSTARTARTARDDHDRRKLTEGFALLEAQTKEMYKTKAEMQSEKEQTQKQVLFINHKIEEIEGLEARYNTSLNGVKNREEAVVAKERNLERREKEWRAEIANKDAVIASLREEIESGKTAKSDIDRRRNALKMVEKTLNTFAKSLESEKEQLRSEKDSFIDMKSEWQRRHRQDQAQMALEDVASHYLRLSHLQQSLSSQLASVSTEKSDLRRALEELEAAQSQVDSERLEIAALKRTLSMRIRDIETKEKSLSRKETELTDFENTLIARQSALDQLEQAIDNSGLILTEREGSDSPIPLATAFSFRPQHSKDSRYRLADLTESLQASLTPRDVITPGSTEQSRDDFDCRL